MTNGFFQPLERVRGIVVVIFRAMWWILATLWLGVRMVWGGVRTWRQLQLLRQETLLCPRGHRAPVFGTWRCGCGAAFDGHVFDRCPVCRRTCGWTPCPVCNLPVHNPALG